MSLEYSGKVYKYLDKYSGKFYNVKKALTYNKPVIAVTGERSAGKSTNVAIYVLLDYLVNGHHFAYIRRHRTDTYSTCKTFFNNAVMIIQSFDDFKIYGFKYHAGKYFIATELDAETQEPLYVECGFAAPLSQEEDLKSSVYSDTFTIIYDEFISKDPNRYLGTKDNPEREWDALTSLYQTIDRGIGRPFRNEVRMFLLGNKATLYNPIFLTLGVCEYIVNGAHFVAPKNEVWVWEDVQGIDATEQMKDSFGYAMSTEFTKKYAYENEGVDNDQFVCKVPKESQYKYTLKLNGQLYGIYSGNERIDFMCKYYVGAPMNCNKVISLDNKSYKETDLQIAVKWREIEETHMLWIRYKKGALYFADGKTKNAFLRYLDFIR